MITEISNAVGQSGRGFGRIAASEVGNRDCCLLGAVARFETEELGLKIAVLLTRCAPRSLHQYGLGDLVAGEDDLADLALRALKRDDKLLAMAVGRERPRRRAADRG